MRIAIISDIHEDLISLQKSLDQILKLKIDKIVCLGDIIGFEKNYYKFDKSRSAQKCFQLINKYSDIIVAGNHELHATDSLPYFKQPIGFPENWYSISMEEKKEEYGHKFFLYRNEAENDLSSEEKEIIKGIKSWEILESNNKRLLFSHFVFPDINGNLKYFANNRDGYSKHFKWMKELNVNISFVGHTHINKVGIIREKGLKVNKFGTFLLKEEPQIILCPPVVSGKGKNGFVLFDTNNMSIKVLAI
jgi:predicted phosphodiesterase